MGCEIIWKGRTYTHRVAVVKSEKCFSFTGRDITHVNQLNQLVYLNLCAPLSAVEDEHATRELKPDAKSKFCSVQKIPLAMQYQFKKKLAKLEGQGIRESVAPES